MVQLHHLHHSNTAPATITANPALMGQIGCADWLVTQKDIVGRGGVRVVQVVQLHHQFWGYCSN